MKTKVCSKCGKRKLVTVFYKNKNASDGLTVWCKICASKFVKRWRQENLKEAKLSSKKYNRRLRLKVVEAYGSECEFCGETAIEYLALDHINGGVEKYSNGYRVSGPVFYNMLKKQGYPKENYRLLCHNCNNARRDYGDERAIELGKERCKRR